MTVHPVVILSAGTATFTMYIRYSISVSQTMWIVNIMYRNLKKL